MARLDEIAKVIRSKNAGPFFLTLDVLFADEASYRRVESARVIEREKMAKLYRQPLENVFVYHHPAALAMKVTMVRATPAGSALLTAKAGHLPPSAPPTASALPSSPDTGTLAQTFRRNLEMGFCCSSGISMSIERKQMKRFYKAFRLEFKR